LNIAGAPPWLPLTGNQGFHGTVFDLQIQQEIAMKLIELGTAGSNTSKSEPPKIETRTGWGRT
jgi:hypothetical protein